MVEIAAISGPWAAFFAGLVTSLHCAGMCGPLACYLAPKPGTEYGFSAVAGLYQATRLISYTMVGALAGGLGMLALGWVQIYQHSLSRFLPWFLVLFFILVALRIDRMLPKPKRLTLWLSRAMARANRLPRPLAAATIGLLTPLLPCGPLYAVFGLALMTQSPVKGAEFLLLFGLGTLPLLWLVQAAFNHWQSRISPQSIALLQRAVALLAAIFIGIRLYLYEIGEHGLFCG